jgi:hypothetical protein
MMLDTLRRMAPPPPVSGPGFAITNLAQALAGGLEAPYQRGIEMAKASEELAKQTAERQLEQQKLATNALYPIYAMNMQRASLLKPDIYQGPYGAWAVTAEGKESLTAPVYKSLEATFGAMQESLGQLLNDQGLPPEFRTALKSAMDAFSAALASGAPPPQLWQLLDRIEGFVDRAPYLGLSLGRLNLEKFRASIYQGRTFLSGSMIRPAQMSLLAAHEVIGLANSAVTMLKNPNLYSKMNQVLQSPEMRAAIAKAGAEVERTMKGPGQFVEYVNRLWERLKMDPKINLQLGKGIFSSPEMTNYYMTLSQIAAWMSYLHTQGKGSVELTLGYGDILKAFYGPESAMAMLASLSRYALDLHTRWSQISQHTLNVLHRANPELGQGYAIMMDPLLRNPIMDPALAARVAVEIMAKDKGVTLTAPTETPPSATAVPAPGKAQPTGNVKLNDFFTVEPHR